MGVFANGQSRPDQGPPRSLLTTLLGLLVVVTAWAFSASPQVTAAPVGVRNDPGDVYDPVAAGEPLPDGFRQVLPRDGIAPIYDPTFVFAAESLWSPQTEVIGVTINGESKAYPISFLGGREMVVDELGGEAILVTW